MKLISEDLVAGLIRYLVQRPYQEVAQAVQALTQLQDAVPEKKPEAPQDARVV